MNTSTSSCMAGPRAPLPTACRRPGAFGLFRLKIPLFLWYNKVLQAFRQAPVVLMQDRSKSMYDMEKMLHDWRLTTAEILYHMPDHPLILQSYTWQELDLIPEFPQLTKFLNFWEREL